MTDLVQLAQNQLTLADEHRKDARDWGLKLSERERDYRQKLAIQEAMLKVKGLPATLIGDVARGEAEVSLAKQLRDSAEIEYKSAMEAINLCKRRIDFLREQIDREWRG